MSYSIIEQYSCDIDFFVFSDTICCHFASAGSNLPKLIEENDVLNEQISHLVNTIQDEDCEHKLNTNLSEIINIEEGTKAFLDYTRDFILYARKGFYSLDKTDINKKNDYQYHVVAYPEDKDVAKNRAHFWMEKINKPIISIRRFGFYTFPNDKSFNINELIFKKIVT